MRPVERIVYTLLNVGGVWKICDWLKADPAFGIVVSLLICLGLAILDRIDMSLEESADDG